MTQGTITVLQNTDTGLYGCTVTPGDTYDIPYRWFSTEPPIALMHDENIILIGSREFVVMAQSRNIDGEYVCRLINPPDWDDPARPAAT